MRSRRLIWILLGLLCLAGVCLLWQKENGRPSRPHEAVAPARLRQATPRQAVRLLSGVSTNATPGGIISAATNKFACRLSNTAKSLDQLMRDDRAILLENALIDTRSPLNFSIPANLRATGDPGAYIVQARGPIDNAFRAMLKASGATIVSYIPNNAYLVRAPAGVANGLAGNPLAQSVISYEPYYKISSSMPVTVGQKTFSSTPMGTNQVAGPSLLALAVKQAPLPTGTCLTLGLFSDNAAATVAQIEKLGGQIVARDSSPFGPIVRVIPPKDWVALAALPGVQIVEPYHPRIHANDLSRATVGVSTDTLVSSNYMGLTGKNVMVEVNDSGIDQAHPDFKTAGSLPIRIIGDSTLSLVDTNGHGTHVAGIIAGDGTESTTVTNAQGSILNDSGHGTNGQFRGKAPLATLYSVAAIDNTFSFLNFSDQYLQQAPALTNALISNNSWNYGDSSYDLAAASYDAAVRDALPEVTGSQPVLFVFSAGNSGGGDNGGFGGNPDTILSPATAKDVITVGALEQPRNITSVVTNLLGQAGQPWQPMTDTGYQVASYSSRGNVGIGFEGTYGRFKPDVVTPGTFVVSTRSEQWNTNAYYNPTNVTTIDYTDQTVDTNAPNYYLINLPPNAVGVTIQVVPNALSPNPLSLPIYVSTTPDPNIYPDPATASTYFLETDLVTIPSDGGAGYLAAAVASGGFNYAVGDSGTQPVSYDLIVDIFTTNDLGNYYQVLQGLNDSLGTSPEYYRYETGTSMAAADVSGVLALMQDFFTNTLNATPSPALLKAMLINGARPTGYYDFQVDNSINYEGWGLINLPSALQPGITTNVNNTTGESMLILDQSPATALATGDSQTFNVAATNTLPLRITLAWTDPPGDPAAAIKLVNDLNLVVTNIDDPANPIVYYGNDIPAKRIYNTPENPNSPPNFDSINNVENVYLPAGAGTNYSVTVVGYRVNVNAVTAQTNNYAGAYAPNVVQDYALVISCGDGSVTNAMTVTANPVVSNPTSDQQITYVSGNSGPLLNQTVGANTPLMGTNTLLFTNSIIVGGETNWQITVGMTNQWHFYVVTNTFASTNAAFTNAAFITFTPDTLSIPRMGVFADSQANATRPQADIDLYVTTDPTLTNLDPVAISNCVVGTQVGASAGVPLIFNGASLSRLGTEFVVDTNSQPDEVYYIGVKSEDQMASEYAFQSVFTATPFSQINPNGDQIVTGVGMPVAIPGGDPAVPGYIDVVAIAIYPIEARRVIVTNTFYAEDFGDLVGAVNHNGTSVILNNHDSLNSPGTYSFTYDDSGQGDVVDPLRPSPRSDGPGSLRSFIGQEGAGEWILHEADSAVGFANNVDNFTLTIEPHLANNGAIITTTIPGGTWFYDYIDVPPGATNLTINATNVTLPPDLVNPLQLYVKLGAEPTQTDYDYETNLDSGTPPGNSISIGLTDVPPLQPGRYFIGIFNPSPNAQNVYIIATFDIGAAPEQLIYNSSGSVPILDDAVTTDSIFVPDDAIIASVDVGLRVDHPRISDLVFHLISPDGTRVLLMENRGGTSTNGCGSSYQMVSTNFAASGPMNVAITNFFDTGQTNGTLAIDYEFYGAPCQMVVYYEGNIIFDSGSAPPGFGKFNISYAGTSTQIEIVMNPSGSGGSWGYIVNVITPQSGYLVLTENTNLTTTPIKFALPPFGSVVGNVMLQPGPGIQNPANGHYYRLLGAGTWTDSEAWAEALGGHLATIRSQEENDWIYNTFSVPGATNLWWIGLYDPSQDNNADGSGRSCSPLPDRLSSPDGGVCHSNNFFWVSGETQIYWNWSASEPNNWGGQEFYTIMIGTNGGYGTPGKWIDEDNTRSVLGRPPLIPIRGIVELNSPSLPPLTDIYYLPEQSLDAFAGKNAGGTWTLEIQDARTGAYLYAYLASWQLRFNFTTPAIPNTAPFWTNSIPIPPQTSDELTLLVITNAAKDTDSPPQTLSYAVTLTVDTNAMIAKGWPLTYATNVPAPVPDSSGIITWTPSEAQGPGVYTITNIVTDNGAPPLSATNSFTVTVNEVNIAPFWTNSIPAQTNYALTQIVVTNTATDPDIPVNPLTYMLSVSPAVPGTNVPVIDTNGIIIWTPDETQAPGVYTLTTIVTDTNAFALINKSLSATNSFVVIVNTNLVCTVNWTNVYQRIDGFGASSAWQSTWTTNQADMFFSTTSGTGVSVDGSTNFPFTGIGLSLLRNHIVPIDPPAIPTTDETNIMIMAQARGAKVWSTPWTPPASFKDNGNIVGGNFLSASNQAYASQLAGYVADMANTWGVNIYAISIQNEPDAVVGYESCYWSPQQFHDFVPFLHNALVASNVASTRIMLPEDMHWQTNYYAVAMSDPSVATNVGIVANHNYDGIDSQHGATTPPAVLPIYSNPNAALWETEVMTTDAFDGSIADGVYWAGRIHAFMTVAQANAWHYWWLISLNDDNEGLTDANGIPAKRMYTLGNFSRFVRPGYYRIDALNTSSALISAYKDSVSPGFAIVAVNTNATSISQTFVLANFTTTGFVTPWITSSTNSLAYQPDITVSILSFTYTLPALSVVTFVGQGSTNTPTIIPLTDGVPATNSIPSGSIIYYSVAVPISANYATNILLFATAPVNVWFNQSTLPSGTNSTGDYLLITNVLTGTNVLSTNSVPLPPLVPGQTYYIGVQNTNSFAVTNAFGVNFDVTINPFFVSRDTIGSSGVKLQWVAPTGDRFRVEWATNISQPMVWMTNDVIITSTNEIFTFADPDATNSPMRFYRLLQVQ